MIDNSNNKRVSFIPYHGIDQKSFLQRRKLAIKAAAVGMISGMLAVAFRMGLQQAEALRTFVLEHYTSPVAFAPALIFSVVLCFVVFLVKRFAPEASGSGIPHLKALLEDGSEFRALRVLAVKFFGGLSGIGAGLALGREGPTVQMGGAIGSLFARFFSVNPSETRLLICAGAGSGLAAAFNAPFAGLLFILEELQHRFDRFSVVVAFSATISANIVCRLAFGSAPIFILRQIERPALSLILWCLLFGIVVGFAGLAFNVVLLRSLKVFSNIRYQLAAALGIIFGVIGLYFPELLGMGHELNEEIIAGHLPLKMLIIGFFARFALTILSYNTGAPGGIFAPLLLLGMMLGGSFYHFVDWFQPGQFDLGVFLVLGMGGMFSAIVRSPLTGIILILEMTGEFELFLPLMTVAIMAYAVPEFANNKPVYDALLENDRHKQAAIKNLQSKKQDIIELRNLR
ncbi:MAG: H(+)/Cl(-) exchange transporter ClcA [Candidatus Riflebacteria bacterium HGW-Riflebacteria-1]|jgi:CIC family chloride channel protein|nr:MAG: H(+)/Cl(-) exchange transporter ClcA [Candidatus Riflebacteria bacterium HGW-Riflebacteria-1]